MKLIIVEGIPGSGKTTTASKIKDYYQDKGLKVKMYQEGDLHPTDLAWCAVMNEDLYLEFYNNYPDLQEKLTEYSKPYNDKYIVAYTRLGIPMKDERIDEYFTCHEYYDRRVPLETFVNTHKELWHDFLTAEHEDDIVIFECALFQNHINELMIMQECGHQTIVDHVLGLIPKNKTCDIEIYYLNTPDTKTTIDRVAKERMSPDLTKWDHWIDLVKKYIYESPFGVKHNLNAPNDIYKVFEKRKVIELAIMNEINAKVHIIDNSNYNWDEVWHKISEKL